MATMLDSRFRGNDIQGRRMLAMVLEVPGQPLVCREVPVPEPKANQLLVQVHACAICRTDLHVVDGELTETKLPLIPGHQIVGCIAAMGEHVGDFAIGDRVGIPWLGHICGHCSYCQSGRENLCDNAKFTGYQIDGGYAEYVVADSRFCFRLTDAYPDLQAAPLLCAGLIGYRALKMTGEADRLGFYGFGAAAHILIQTAHYQGRKVYAFTRPGDARGQAFALELGAVWAGDSTQAPPEKLNAAILFAPVGELVPLALRSVVKGGTVVCAGIHMSDIPSFPYSILWGERTLRSVANLTRRDGEEFLTLASKIPIRSQVEVFPLGAANEALSALREGRIDGAGVVAVRDEYRS
jgi:alcohol dehydrogenase, propanol-preferring